MPRIPVPLRTTSNQGTGRKIRQGSATGDALQVLGQAGQEAFNKIERARSLAERTKAQNERDTRYLEIQARALNDTDLSPQNQKSYDDEIRKANSESAKLISIPEDRSLFELESESKSSISIAKIQGGFRKKEIEQGAADLGIFIDNKENEFIQAETPAGKQSAILERDNKIREGVKSGYISAADATKKIDDLNKDWAKAQVEHDIDVNPEMALSILEQNSYPDISEKDRVKYINEAKNMSEKIQSNAKRILKKQQIEKESGYISDFIQGDLDIKMHEIGQSIARRDIRPEFGNALIKAIQTPFDEIDLEDDDEAFLSMANSFLEVSDQENINDVIMDILNGFSSGNLGQRKMQLLIEASRKFGESTEIKNQLSNVISIGIKAGLSNDSEMVEDYIGQINQGKEPAKAFSSAVRNKQVKMNPERANYEVGQIVERGNRSGKVIGYREDGMPIIQEVK